MITYRDVSASIHVNDIDLPHFQPEYDEETRTVSCWVPSEAGKPYAVWWKLERNLGLGADIVGRIYLDGGADMQTGAYCNMTNVDGVSKDASRVSVDGERAFLFADAELTGTSRLSLACYFGYDLTKSFKMKTTKPKSPLCKQMPTSEVSRSPCIAFESWAWYQWTRLCASHPVLQM